jgi:hypothetical protein
MSDMGHSNKDMDREFYDDKFDGYETFRDVMGTGSNGHLRCIYCPQMKHRPERMDCCGECVFEIFKTDQEISDEKEEDDRILHETVKSLCNGMKMSSEGYIKDSFVIDSEDESLSDEEGGSGEESEEYDPESDEESEESDPESDEEYDPESDEESDEEEEEEEEEEDDDEEYEKVTTRTTTITKRNNRKTISVVTETTITKKV